MFKLTPEAQKRVEDLRNYQDAKKAHFASLTDENLVASAKLYMANMSPLHFAPGEPIYDATMWHVILPELLRRVGK